MPLLDHFHPPLLNQFPWDAFHSTWATRLADALNDQWLSPEFIAAEHAHAGGGLEIDVATFERPSGRPVRPTNGSPVATLPPATWSPPAVSQAGPEFPEASRCASLPPPATRLTLVAAIELISPGNKDRPEERQAFAAKCASYLHQGIALVLIDIVTSRRANLHNETMRLMNAADEFLLPADAELYAAAYRPVLRQKRAEIDLWTAPVAVGDPLPTLPLRLTGDLFVPVDFEAAYMEACRRRRLA